MLVYVRKILFSRDNCFLPNIYLLSSPLQCAESGVKYLEAMLCVRSPLMMDAMTDVSAKNEDLMQLLKEGDRLNLFTVLISLLLTMLTILRCNLFYNQEPITVMNQL